MVDCDATKNPVRSRAKVLLHEKKNLFSECDICRCLHEQEPGKCLVTTHTRKSQPIVFIIAFFCHISIGSDQYRNMLTKNNMLLQLFNSGMLKNWRNVTVVTNSSCNIQAV